MPLPADAHLEARRRIDEVHRRDPELEDGQPAELLYAERMEAWILRLDPTAPELLRLAARCQHLERWSVPRASFPQDRAGYLRWRTSLYGRQADAARDLLLAAGLPATDADAVRAWVAKSDLKGNPGSQALEDAACLVFLAHELASFAQEKADYPPEKWIGIIRKTWGKMSPRAHALALAIPLPEDLKALVAQALSGPPPVR